MSKDKEEKLKKPMNIYFRVRNDNYEKLKIESPELTHKELISKVGEIYKNLSDSKKKEYQDAFDEETIIYKEKLDKLPKKSKEEKDKAKKSKTNDKKSKKEEVKKEKNPKKEKDDSVKKPKKDKKDKKEKK